MTTHQCQAYVSKRFNEHYCNSVRKMNSGLTKQLSHIKFGKKLRETRGHSLTRDYKITNKRIT